MYDRIAILLSGICLIHCLLLPGVISLLPVAATSFLVSEEFHLWILAVVIPTSAFALLPALRRHRDRRPIIIAATGISLLVIATLAHDQNNEVMDQIITSFGGVVVAVAHIMNFRLMRQSRASILSQDSDVKSQQSTTSI